jgi:hypothetical protein
MKLELNRQQLKYLIENNLIDDKQLKYITLELLNESYTNKIPKTHRELIENEEKGIHYDIPKEMLLNHQDCCFSKNFLNKNKIRIGNLPNINLENEDNKQKYTTEKTKKPYRKYTPEFIAEIQKRVDNGEKLTNVCKELHLYYNGLKDRIIKKKV